MASKVENVYSWWRHHGRVSPEGIAIEVSQKYIYISQSENGKPTCGHVSFPTDSPTPGQDRVTV